MKILSSSSSIQEAILANLNDEQREAARYTEGPLLIVAGPGTGKTRVLTHRVAYLLAVKPDLKPSQVLALTFTKKAAEEMSSRISLLLPGLSSPPSVATFHSFAGDILRTIGMHGGVSAGFRILTSDLERAPFVKDILLARKFEYYDNLKDPLGGLTSFLRFIDRAKDELIAPADFKNYVEKLKTKLRKDRDKLDKEESVIAELEIKRDEEAHDVYKAYQDAIEKAGALDFGDLIMKTVSLFTKRPNLLKKARQDYRYILVDEFQDTNVAQIELLRLLAGDNGNICAVGDDDQAIYRFRGASYASFNQFKALFPSCRIMKVTENFRSGANIIKAANYLILHNGEDRFDTEKNLWTRKPKGTPVAARRFSSFEDEARWIAREIKSRYGKLSPDEKSYGVFAVLVRTNKQKEDIAERFKAELIPFNERDKVSILSHSIVRDATALLRLIDNPEDNISLARVLMGERIALVPDKLKEISLIAKTDKCAHIKALETALVRRNVFGPDESLRIAKFIETIGSLRRISVKEDANFVLRRMLEGLHIVSWLIGVRTHDAEESLNALGHFAGFVADFCEANPRANSLKDFLRYLELADIVGFSADVSVFEEEKAEGVSLITAHSAKGLEFPYVFVANLSENRFPVKNRPEEVSFPDELLKELLPKGDSHEQEERRLFYVSMTRAQNALYLTGVERPYVRPSRFLNEVLSGNKEFEIINETDRNKTATAAAPSILMEPEKEEDAVKEARALFEMAFSGNAAPLSKDEVEKVVLSFLLARPVKPDKKLADGTIKTLESIGFANAADKLKEFYKRNHDKSQAACAMKRLVLSHSQIEDYDSCPLRYKFKYIYGIPPEERAPLKFGTCMHATLEYFYRIMQEERVLGEEELISYYESIWDGRGYESATQEESYKKKGYDILKAYYKSNRAGFAKPPIHIEKKFLFRVGDVEMTGKIDRIDSGPDGKVEVIDYKTGKEKDQKNADESLQLAIYALACREEFKLDADELSFYYLEPGKKVSTQVDEKRIADTSEKIIETASLIRGGNFPPCEEKHRYMRCSYCEYKPLCPVWDR